MARASRRDLPASPVMVAGRAMPAITSLTSGSGLWRAARLAEFGKQGADAVGDALMAAAILTQVLPPLAGGLHLLDATRRRVERVIGRSSDTWQPGEQNVQVGLFELLAIGAVLGGNPQQPPLVPQEGPLVA